MPLHLLFFCVWRREWRLTWRNISSSLNSVWFFIMVCTLFVIGIGPDRQALAEIAPGVIWVIALLATMLAVDGLFRHDFTDGSLAQWLLSSQPWYFLLLFRLLTQAVFIALPLALVAPFLGLLMDLPGMAVLPLVASLLLGIPVLVLLGAIGAALTVGFERGGLLLAVLILPLYIPVLIFAIAAVQAAALGTAYSAHLALLATLLLLALALCPLAVNAALRLNFYY